MDDNFCSFFVFFYFWKDSDISYKFSKLIPNVSRKSTIVHTLGEFRNVVTIYPLWTVYFTIYGISKRLGEIHENPWRTSNRILALGNGFDRFPRGGPRFNNRDRSHKDCLTRVRVQRDERGRKHGWISDGVTIRTQGVPWISCRTISWLSDA